jgi:hypothetical protein
MAYQARRRTPVIPASLRYRHYATGAAASGYQGMDPPRKGIVMNRLMPALLIAPLLLAACGQGASSDQPTTNVTVPEGDYAQAIRTMPQGQRVGVMFRAIRDAGRECQQVTDVKEAKDIEGAPTWVAVCNGNARWLVAIDAGGIATVTNATELKDANAK